MYILIGNAQNTRRKYETGQPTFRRRACTSYTGLTFGFRSPNDPGITEHMSRAAHTHIVHTSPEHICTHIHTHPHMPTLIHCACRDSRCLIYNVGWLQVVALFHSFTILVVLIRPLCNTMQDAASQFKTLRRTATHCDALRRTATHYKTHRHTATHCLALQHTATYTTPTRTSCSR